MKLMQSDVACGWCEKQRASQQTRLFFPEFKTSSNTVGDGPHCRESAVLHDNKHHRVAEHREDGCKKKNDWLNMISEQRNIFDRNLKAPVNELPNGLDIICEIERPVLKVGPACVRYPSANGEEERRDGDCNCFSGIRCESIDYAHNQPPR